MQLLAASLPEGRSPVLCHHLLVSEEDAAAQSIAGRQHKHQQQQQQHHYHHHNQQQVPACTRFVEQGISELIKARRILCGSYVYGYYLEDNGYNKTFFEFMQVSGLIIIVIR